MADPRSLVRDYVNDDLRPNYAGFVVIGAGLPRTGTMSLRAALGKVAGFFKTRLYRYEMLVYHVWVLLSSLTS